MLSRKLDLSEDLRQLSRALKLTSGKWLITVPWDESDAIWNNLKKAFVENKLPEEVRFIKVSRSISLICTC
jgi:hypothetical protein